MSNSNQPILVPVKVTAFIADAEVIGKSDPSSNLHQGWLRKKSDYLNTTQNLGPMGPDYFFLPPSANEIPNLMGDFGVHLHWTLPDGLRHGFQNQDGGSLLFPPLPDQWLIVRFSRSWGFPIVNPPTESALDPKAAQSWVWEKLPDANVQAWFIDGSLQNDEAERTSTPQAKLVFPKKGSADFEALAMGKVTELAKGDGFTRSSSDEAMHTTLTAVGNATTGSPFFTAFVSDNRNMFSWQDDLSDLCLGGSPTINPDLVLSYAVVGWYYKPGDDPLAWFQQQGVKGVLNELGWEVGPLPAKNVADSDLPQRCLFHGMVTLINYWSKGKSGPHSYAGNIFGSPDPAKISIGVGYSLYDAWVALLSKGGPPDNSALTAWGLMEAAIYRQLPSLLKPEEENLRQYIIHQSWFNPVNGGSSWSIQAQESADRLPFPTVQGEMSKPSPQPTHKQLDLLGLLNSNQTRADELARNLSSSRQEIYARQWLEIFRQRHGLGNSPVSSTDDLQKAMNDLESKINDIRGNFNILHPDLMSSGLDLKVNPASRFWKPSDPVLMVSGAGCQEKHRDSDVFICRWIGDPANRKLAVQPFGLTTDPQSVAVTMLKAITAGLLSDQSLALQLLLDEAVLVERIVFLHALVTSIEIPQITVQNKTWSTWVKELADMISSQTIDVKAEPEDGTQISGLASLWREQPWSPLFLDWKIKYYPYPQAPQTEASFSNSWRAKTYDLIADNVALGACTQGKELSGRSLLTSNTNRFWIEPMEEFSHFIDTLASGDLTGGNQARDFLQELYKTTLQRIFADLSDKTAQLTDNNPSDLLIQALSGFQQGMLRRNPSLPQIDLTANTFSVHINQSFSPDHTIQLPDLPDLPPPEPTVDGLDFSLLQAGTFEFTQLCLVDDFGQWVNVPIQNGDGLTMSPRSTLSNGSTQRMVLPPRIVQPARLDFCFTTAKNLDQLHQPPPGDDLICGWVFHNYLDQALMVCDHSGEVVGELVLVEGEHNLSSVVWMPLKDPVNHIPRINQIEDETLRGFVQGLSGEQASSNPPLKDLLVLIDDALIDIRPQGRNIRRFPGGRLLALVNARLGLDLYGAAWTDPALLFNESPTSGRTGDSDLDAISFPVELGYAPYLEDGLIGYYIHPETGESFNHLIPVKLPPGLAQSSYVLQPQEHCAQVSFRKKLLLTLLLDPYGAVHASTRILPSKSIELPSDFLDKVIAQMEPSFRVAPVLLHKLQTSTQPEATQLPLPRNNPGLWHFRWAEGSKETKVGVNPLTYTVQYHAPNLVAYEGRLGVQASQSEPSSSSPKAGNPDHNEEQNDHA